MKLKSHVGTTLGKNRVKSEDAYFCDDELGLYIVCDGSTAGEGQWAAETACKTIEEVIRRHKAILTHYNSNLSPELRKQVGEIVNSAIQEATSVIYEEQVQDPSKAQSMTTVVLLLVLKDSFVVAHAGNSRAYLKRGKKVIPLTDDETSFYKHVKNGLDPSSIDKRLKKDLLNAVGINRSIPIEIKFFAVSANDLFLLCSDGLHEAVLVDSKLNEIGVPNDAVALPLDSVANNLIKDAVLNETSDNATLILVSVGGTTNKDVSKPETDTTAGQVELVRKVSVFREIADDESKVLKIHRLFRFVKVKKGQAIISQGDPSINMFILLSGAVDIVVNGEKKASQSSYGDVFGEIGVFTGENRTAEVVTSMDSKFIAISRDDLDQAISRDPELGLKIFRGVISELSRKLSAISRVS